MKKLFTALLCAAIALCISAASPGDVPLRDSVPFTVRGGTPNTAARLKAGEPVTIAYFGGSITEQNGWRLQSAELLKSLYPEAKITAVNAAIGGTGSDLGAFRLEHDVLRHRPDLVFVEFAVNDSGARPERIYKAMEGIVRHIRKALPEADICFVYTVTAATLKDYQNGKFPYPASIMEEIADRYRIPTVNISYEIAQLEKDGKLVMAGKPGGMERVSGDELNEHATLPRNAEGKIVFSGDGVHPYPDTGHKLYTKMLAQALPGILKAGTPGKAPLPEPITPGCWENTVAVALDAPGIRLSGNVVELPADHPVAKQFATRVPKLWKLSPGSSIEFKFKGSKAMFYDLLGPDTGTYEITVDSKSRENRRFDGYCTYRRLGLCGIADNLPDAVHTVRIAILPRAIDKRAILFERNRGKFDANAAEYAPTDAYIGMLYFVGELLP